MYQLVFRHYGADETNGSVHICVENNFEKAKDLSREWMNAYIKYVEKCENEEIKDIESLTIEEVFFNEYTFGTYDDLCDIKIYKLKTMNDIKNIVEKNKNNEDYNIMQKLLFDDIYTISYVGGNITEVDNGN